MGFSYTLNKIEDLDDMYSGNHVLIRGRVVRLYYDSSDNHAYLTVADHSGMVLAKVSKGPAQTILVGAIVHVRGTIALSKDMIYVNAQEVAKIQTVEDGYSQLAEIPLPKEDEIPAIQGKKLVKPFGWQTEKMKKLYSVTVREGRKVEWAVVGCIMCAIGLLLPIVIGVLVCILGFILLLAGILTEKAWVSGYEPLTTKALIAFLLSHHTADKIHRCLRLNFGSHQLHLCARCTGSYLGIMTGFFSLYLFKHALNEVQLVFLICLLALPALLDWSTQKLDLRESANEIRVATGFLLGLGSVLIMSVNMLFRGVAIIIPLSIFIVLQKKRMSHYIEL